MTRRTHAAAASVQGGPESECVAGAGDSNARSGRHEHSSRLDRTVSALVTRWRVGLVAVLLSASAGLLMTVLFTQDRPDHQTDPSAQQEAVTAASEATVTLLSYGPETIDSDLDAARSLMTGGFATYYGKFTTDVVAPAVRDRGVEASAQVVDSALMEIRPNWAKVLVFLNQQTVSRERPEPAFTASTVIVTVVKVDDSWLISEFEPV